MYTVSPICITIEVNKESDQIEIRWGISGLVQIRWRWKFETVNRKREQSKQAAWKRQQKKCEEVSQEKAREDRLRE